MSKPNPNSGGVASEPEEVQSALDAAQGDTQAEGQEITEAILQHLQMTSAAVTPQPLGTDGAAFAHDDLLPAALSDLTPQNIEQALDQLANSPDLFDLPTLDFAEDGGGGGS